MIFFNFPLINFIHPCRLCALAQAQEDIQSRSTPGISLTQGHTQQNKSFQQSTPAANPETSGQRKRLVSTVDDFTDFVWADKHTHTDARARHAHTCLRAEVKFTFTSLRGRSQHDLEPIGTLYWKTYKLHGIIKAYFVMKYWYVKTVITAFFSKIFEMLMLCTFKV